MTRLAHVCVNMLINLFIYELALIPLNGLRCILAFLAACLLPHSLAVPL